MDLELVYWWEDYLCVKDEMMVYIDIFVSFWYVVEFDIKKYVWLNMMVYLLFMIDYVDVEKLKVKLLLWLFVSGNYRCLFCELLIYVDDYVVMLIVW